MSKIVRIVQQKIDKETGMSYHNNEDVIVDDSFDLFNDYFAYVIGEKKDANGNQVYSGMIGKNKLVRFADIVDIEVIENPVIIEEV